MIYQLLDQGLLTTGNLCMYEVTDGCGKQYRNRNSWMFLSLLEMKHDIIVDRALYDPGHDNGVVNVIQGSDN